MGTLRSETYDAGGFLIDRLRDSGLLEHMLHDGGDIMLMQLHTGEPISVQMIESGIPVYEIRKIIEENTSKGIYTLFMLWASMMVPDDGKPFKWADRMAAFNALNDGVVYAYDIYNGDVFLFSVSFSGGGDFRTTEYGTTVRAGHIACRDIEIDLPDFKGTYKVAYFERAPYEGRQREILDAIPLTTLELCYAVLGVAPGDDRETVKQAYRMLARRYHPDTNPDDPEAHDQMQKLNHAYEMIMRTLE